MSLTSEAERILAEEAARVVAIGGAGSSGADAARNGGAAGGGALGGFLGGPAGAALGAGLGRAIGDAGFEWLTGASSDKKREMRQAARRVAGRLAELLGREVRADIERRGLGGFYDAIAGDARITRWSDTLPDISDLRGVPLGEGQRAARIYMDAAAPGSRVAVPSAMATSDAWRLMTQVWGDFSAVAGRFVAVMAAYDRRGLPDPSAGAQALSRAYPRQWAQVERSTQDSIFGATGSAAQSGRQNTAPTANTVPSWPAEGLPQGLQSINPATGKVWIANDGWFQMTEAQQLAWLTARGLPLEYAYADGEARYRAKNPSKTKSKRSGGAAPLIVGVLTVAGVGVAAATKFMGKAKRRKGRRR